MIQLILRDLSPLIYPPPSSSGIIATTEYNSAAYKRLEVWQVLREWHPAGDAQYRVVKDLDYVGKILEDLLSECESRQLPAHKLSFRFAEDGGAPPKPLPFFGVPVQVSSFGSLLQVMSSTRLHLQIPKANRPGICAVVCKELRGRVAVETKYDGERCADVRSGSIDE